MLEQMVRAVVRKTIAETYPHLKQPAILCASVLRAVHLGAWNEHTLQIVDRFGIADERFPALPGVRARARYEPGCTVAVGFAYGDTPVILGEVQL